MKSIIVATDFSKNGDDALRYAVNAAFRHGAKLILMTSYNPELYNLHTQLSSVPTESLISMQIKRLAAVKDIIKITYALDVEYHLIVGNFIEDLRQKISFYRSELLIVGLCQKTIQQNLDPMTEHETEFFPSVLKNSFEHNSIKRVLFPSGFLSVAPKNIFCKIKDYAAGYGATVDEFEI